LRTNFFQDVHLVAKDPAPHKKLVVGSQAQE
jgi:hypothetical protein